MFREFPYERLARQVQLAKPTEKRLRGLPRPRCNVYIFDHAWSRLDVEPTELSNYLKLMLTVRYSKSS